MSAVPDQTKGSLSEHFTELVACINVFHELELFVVGNVQSLLLGGLDLLRSGVCEVFTDFTHVIVRLEGLTQALVLKSQCGVVVS